MLNAAVSSLLLMQFILKTTESRDVLLLLPFAFDDECGNKRADAKHDNRHQHTDHDRSFSQSNDIMHMNETVNKLPVLFVCPATKPSLIIAFGFLL